jgi:hypothetical protein
LPRVSSNGRPNRISLGFGLPTDPSKEKAHLSSHDCFAAPGVWVFDSNHLGRTGPRGCYRTDFYSIEFGMEELNVLSFFRC